MYAYNEKWKRSLIQGTVMQGIQRLVCQSNRFFCAMRRHMSTTNALLRHHRGIGNFTANLRVKQTHNQMDPCDLG